MASGITFNAEIYLSRQEYNENVYAVEDKISEIESDIESIRTKLSMFASSNLKDIVPEEWNEQPIDWLNNQISEYFNTFEKLVKDRFELQLYSEYLKEPKTDEI